MCSDIRRPLNRTAYRCSWAMRESLTSLGQLSVWYCNFPGDTIPRNSLTRPQFLARILQPSQLPPDLNRHYAILLEALPQTHRHRSIALSALHAHYISEESREACQAEVDLLRWLLLDRLRIFESFDKSSIAGPEVWTNVLMETEDLSLGIVPRALRLCHPVFYLDRKHPKKSVGFAFLSASHKGRTAILTALRFVGTSVPSARNDIHVGGSWRLSCHQGLYVVVKARKIPRDLGEAPLNVGTKAEEGVRTDADALMARLRSGKG